MCQSPITGSAAGQAASPLAWKDKKSGSGSSFQKERIENILKEPLREAGCGGAGEENAEEDHGAPALRPDGLQREASRRFDYSAKETLNIMQRLYENHKVLTYPRTDSGI